MGSRRGAVAGERDEGLRNWVGKRITGAAGVL